MEPPLPSSSALPTQVFPSSPPQTSHLGKKNPYLAGKYITLTITIVGVGLLIGGCCVGKFGESTLSNSLINRLVPSLVGAGIGITLFSAGPSWSFWDHSSEWNAIQEAQEEDERKRKTLLTQQLN